MERINGLYASLTKFFVDERNMMIAIALSAISIFLLAFPALSNNAFLVIIDLFFIALFTVEAIVKIMHFGLRDYFKSRWNTFDFIIVLFSLPSLLLLIPGVAFPDWSFIIAFRVFRLMRIFRLLRFVPNIQNILYGLIRAFKASIFVFIALFIMSFVTALITCHLYADVAPEYFGNPLISLYTIGQLFTLEGWTDIPERIAEVSDNAFLIHFSRLYFLVVVLTGGILGMSLANAIFVDEMTMDNNRPLEEKIDRLEEQIVQLKELVRTGTNR